MTDETLRRLAEIEERAKRATPGPWEAYNVGAEWLIRGPKACNPVEPPGNFGRKEDAQFIAHARTDIPWLISLVRSFLEVVQIIASLRPPIVHDYTGTYSRMDLMLDTTDKDVCIYCGMPISNGHGHSDDCPWLKLRAAISTLVEENKEINKKELMNE